MVAVSIMVGVALGAKGTNEVLNRLSRQTTEAQELMAEHEKGLVRAWQALTSTEPISKSVASAVSRSLSLNNQQLCSARITQLHLLIFHNYDLCCSLLCGAAALWQSTVMLSLFLSPVPRSSLCMVLKIPSLQAINRICLHDNPGCPLPPLYLVCYKIHHTKQSTNMAEASVPRMRKRKAPVSLSSAWEGFRARSSAEIFSDDCIPVKGITPKLRCRNITRLFQPFNRRTSNDNTYSESFVQLEDSDEDTEVEDANESPGNDIVRSSTNAPLIQISEVEALLSEDDQMVESLWTCSRCTLHNSHNDSKCTVCGQPRQGMSVVSVKKRRIIVDDDEDENVLDNSRPFSDTVNTRICHDNEAISVAENIDSDGSSESEGEYESFSEESGDEDSIYGAPTDRRSGHVIDLTDEPEPAEVVEVRDEIEDFDDVPGPNGTTFNEPALMEHFM